MAFFHRNLCKSLFSCTKQEHIKKTTSNHYATGLHSHALCCFSSVHMAYLPITFDIDFSTRLLVWLLFLKYIKAFIFQHILRTLCRQNESKLKAEQLVGYAFSGTFLLCFLFSLTVSALGGYNIHASMEKKKERPITDRVRAGSL